MRATLRMIAEAAASWHRFWFQPSDPLPLCVLRILVGTMLLYTHGVWGLDLAGFFGPAGWNNAGVLQSLQEGSMSWSAWWWIPQSAESAFHYGCLVVLLLFCIGCFTRITAVLAWAITVSYAHRSMLANFGLDQINAMLTFYLMLAPCGARLSVDRWWRAKKQRSVVSPHAAATLATRLIQVHLCVIYVWAGLSKLQGSAWWTGDAVWQVIANHEYQSLDVTWMAHYPIVLQLATHGVLLFELTFPFAMLHHRTRTLALLFGAAMHLGIGMFLGMWTFGLVMIMAYISFVDAESLRAVACWLRSVVGRATRSPKILPDRDLAQVGADGSTVLALPAPAESSDELVVGVDDVSNTSMHSPISEVAAWSEIPTASEALSAAEVPVTLGTRETLEESESPSSETSDLEFMPPVRIARGSMPGDRDSARRRRYATDELIYVARSKQQRAHVRAYFRRHQLPCLVLRGAAELIEKTVNRRKATIVLRSKDFSAGELQYWIEELVATNPEGQFRVFLLPDPKEPTSPEGLEVPPGVKLYRLSATTTLRRIRKLFCNQDWDEVPADRPAGDNHTSNSAIRRAKLMSWLLLSVTFLGCGAKRDAPSVHLERARMLLERGQMHESVQAFSEALSSSEGSANDYYDRGVAYERLGQLEQAAADYSEALRRMPSHPQALNNRGVVLAQLDRVEEAMVDLGKAIELDPNDSLAWSNRGLAHHDAGNYVEAISDYSQALFLKKEARLYFQRGNVYVDFDKLEQATADFTEALAIDSSHLRAYVNRGNALVQLGRFDEAIADLRAASELDRELSMKGAIAQLEQRIRGRQWQKTAAAGLQSWLATQGYELRPMSEASPLATFAAHKTGDATGIPCLITPTGPRGAPVFESRQSEELIEFGNDVALFVVDKQALIETSPNDSPEQPAWLKDWRFRWRPLASDFIPSQVEVLLGPPADE